jgi:hypothetical protein
LSRARRLSVTVVDAGLDRSAPMWGDASDDPGAAATEWICTLSAAGVAVRGLASPDSDDSGLLIVPEPEAWPELIERATSSGRPLLTGAPPASIPERLAAVREALGALVRPDFRNLLVLRLDDPGASVRCHLREWRHEAVHAESWDALWAALRGFGRASVFCCPGWVESDGSVVDSRSRNPDEWAGVERGREAGLADLECHGYTHMHPDTSAWARAPDKHHETGWFRELWSPLEPEEPPAERQAEIIARWQEACGDATTLVAPGEGWGVHTLEAARLRGLELFTSWGVCRLTAEVPTWSRGIGSPYLDEVSPGWFESGLPVVGYWHDRDMAVSGPGWAPGLLSDWRDAGARRAWAFADLARAYRTPIDAELQAGRVTVRSGPDVPLLVEQA